MLVRHAKSHFVWFLKGCAGLIMKGSRMKYIALSLGLVAMCALGGCAQKPVAQAPVNAGHVTVHAYHGGKTGN